MTKMTSLEWIYEGVVLAQQGGQLPPVDPPAEGDDAAAAAAAAAAAKAPPLDPKDAAADAGEGEEGEKKPAETKPPPPPAADWKDRRIAQLTARLRESERKAASVSTQTGEQSATPPAAVADAAELDRLVEQRASEKTAIDDFNRRCNETVASGKEAFPDFDAKVSDLKGLVDFSNPTENVNWNQFLIAALETGEAPALLHRLGSNLNEAMRILALSPMKMAVELTKLSAAPPPAEVSSAPRPIRPPGGPAGGSREPIDPTDPERSDRLTTAEWMRRRNAQEASRGRDGRRA